MAKILHEREEFTALSHHKQRKDDSCDIQDLEAWMSEESGSDVLEVG